MQREQAGWFGLDVPGVVAGELYKFRVEGADVPDPASRFNPHDALGPSQVVDPRAFRWDDDLWRGRPWREAVLYELHVGTFTPEGTFAAAVGKLDYLLDLGITAIEVMPVADFPGKRGWGYDGVLPFAPDSVYGTPDDFKRFVVECHRRGLMVLLDVVYNHFGPEGNFLHLYAPQFFNEAHQTPWGAAVNFDGKDHFYVRDFYVHNALYWIEEYHLDGLRLDAVHAIADDSHVHIVGEIAAAIAMGPGSERHIHLVLENEKNEAAHLEGDAPRATAQWHDPVHHELHVLLTGERHGYYAPFTEKTVLQLGRSLAEGFGRLAPECYVAFLQNHDQVGNRARGERIGALAHDPEAIRLAAATLILSPQIPLLFMGEEFGAATPFQYFVDFEGELAQAVREGRKREFAMTTDEIPDPTAESTFLASKLDWASLDKPGHAQWLAFHRNLLALRRLKVVPHLDGRAHASHFDPVGSVGLQVQWAFGDGSRLAFHGNFGRHPLDGFTPVPGSTVLHLENGAAAEGPLPAWGGRWLRTAP